MVYVPGTPESDSLHQQYHTKSLSQNDRRPNFTCFAGKRELKSSLYSGRIFVVKAFDPFPWKLDYTYYTCRRPIRSWLRSPCMCHCIYLHHLRPGSPVIPTCIRLPFWTIFLIYNVSSTSLLPSSSCISTTCPYCRQHLPVLAVVPLNQDVLDGTVMHMLNKVASTSTHFISLKQGHPTMCSFSASPSAPNGDGDVLDPSHKKKTCVTHEKRDPEYTP